MYLPCDYKKGCIHGSDCARSHTNPAIIELALWTLLRPLDPVSPLFELVHSVQRSLLKLSSAHLKTVGLLQAHPEAAAMLSAQDLSVLEQLRFAPIDDHTALHDMQVLDSATAGVV